jgi:two-component system response regulator FixJ
MGTDGSELIFVVASDPAIARSIEFLLQVQDFSVRSFHSGHKLLEVTTWPSKGCLVIEQNMPEMTGLDLLITLRSDGINLPAILTTSRPTAELQRQAATAGFQCVLDKPLVQSLFLAALREALPHP